MAHFRRPTIRGRRAELRCFVPFKRVLSSGIVVSGRVSSTTSISSSCSESASSIGSASLYSHVSDTNSCHGSFEDEADAIMNRFCEEVYEKVDFNEAMSIDLNLSHLSQLSAMSKHGSDSSRVTPNSQSDSDGFPSWVDLEFGWACLGGQKLPYTFRKNVKYCSMDMATDNIYNQFGDYGKDVFELRTLMNTYRMTNDEANVYTHINNTFCSDIYDYRRFYHSKCFLVRLSSAKRFFKGVLKFGKAMTKEITSEHIYFQKPQWNLPTEEEPQ